MAKADIDFEKNSWEKLCRIQIGLEGDEKKDYKRIYRTELTINNLLDLQK